MSDDLRADLLCAEAQLRFEGWATGVLLSTVDYDVEPHMPLVIDPQLLDWVPDHPEEEEPDADDGD